MLGIVGTQLTRSDLKKAALCRYAAAAAAAAAGREAKSCLMSRDVVPCLRDGCAFEWSPRKQLTRCIDCVW